MYFRRSHAEAWLCLNKDELQHGLYFALDQISPTHDCGRGRNRLLSVGDNPNPVTKFPHQLHVGGRGEH